MENYTKYQARYFAEQISLKRPASTVDSFASTMSGSKVDLNPHQVDAALFAVKSPLSGGALLADEVGLGKTIEAGLVLAQFWSERKRHIILIVPASLRMQWRSELKDKFFIDSVIMESTVYNKEKKSGIINPFDKTDGVIICSYNFAARKDSELRSVPWDLVVMDEAHKLRNVYKKTNVMGNKLKNALSHAKKKLLLTATPLQNNLMELYGLTSIIDDHVFGDEKTFKDVYISVANTELRNKALKMRLKNFCKRTLRSQVSEYVKYTSRIPILQEYSPTKDEEDLYNGISEYLQTEKLYALPEGQRNLITLVLRKLLASSSFAIKGTLESLIERLRDMRDGYSKVLEPSDFDDFDAIDEYEDDFDNENALNDTIQNDVAGITKEIELLEGFYQKASSITMNSKGENLLQALDKGFDKITELKGERKAVIFTESKRTQAYVFNLLKSHGYGGKIVFLNGANNDPISKEIYAEWKERHKNDGQISGSKTADIKAAIVEAFREKANILIGTEAASEGINLQFCSIVVNYDLPWNPQRIEQRIGRCHRYGQKNDVVVINFLNKKNAADVRVYELLDQKFRLFDGVFGSSDEVLGSLESGVDFEKRIAEIYQKCKTQEDIQREFDELQSELSEQIDSKMKEARQSILENFDEDVSKILESCRDNTVRCLGKFNQWMYYFFLIHGAERVEPLNEMRFRYKDKDRAERTYNLKWQDAEKAGDRFLRCADELFSDWLNESMSEELPLAHITFNNSASSRHISFFDNNRGLNGVLSVDKISYDGIGQEEHLVFTAVAENGVVIDDEMINNLFELPGKVTGTFTAEPQKLIDGRVGRISAQKREIENANIVYFKEECEKLDAYSDELKEGLERELKETDKLLKAKKKEFHNVTGKSLSEILDMKDEINILDKKRKNMRRTIYERQDEIDAENERLQEEMRSKLEGKLVTDHIMTFSFDIA